MCIGGVIVDYDRRTTTAGMS